MTTVNLLPIMRTYAQTMSDEVHDLRRSPMNDVPLDIQASAYDAPELVALTQDVFARCDIEAAEGYVFVVEEAARNFRSAGLPTLAALADNAANRIDATIIEAIAERMSLRMVRR